MAKVKAQAASRALGMLLSKFKLHEGLPSAVYSKLYDAYIELWCGCKGTKESSFIDIIQHRACNLFLGVGKSAILAVLPTPERVNSCP